MELINRISKQITSLHEYVIYVVFTFVMLVKGGYYGYKYNPILDDFIQYNANTLYENPFKDVIIGTGLLNGRPLAGIFDLFFWSNFWDNMWLANLIIVLLHTASAILIYRLFARHFNTTPVFLFIYGLLPVGSEAVNWLSASSRLVVPMFFLGIALNLIQAHFDTDKRNKKIYCCVLGMICLFASMAFYEQITILAFVTACALLFINKRRLFDHLILFIPSVLIASFYLFMDTASIYSDRSNIINISALPSELYQHGASAYSRILYALFPLNFETAQKGFIKGTDILSADANIVFIILLVIAAAMVFFLMLFHDKKQGKEQPDEMPNVFILIFSLILIFMPMLIFFLLQNPWVSMRNVFPSILGFALFFDLIFRWLLYNKYVRSIVVTSLCVVFIIANVAEMHDYLAVGEIDKKIAQETVKVVMADKYKFENDIPKDDKDDRNTADVKKDFDTVVILNTKDTYIDAALQYNEHINNITSSDWAYKGAIASTAKTTDVPQIYPLKEGLIEELFPKLDTNDIDACYYMDEDFKLHRLTVVPYKENYVFYDGDTVYAELVQWQNQDPTIIIAGNKEENVDDKK